VANRNPNITPSKSWLDRRGHLVGITKESRKVTLVHVLLAELITRDTLNDSSLHFIMRIWGTALAGVKVRLLRPVTNSPKQAVCYNHDDVLTTIYVTSSH
jgi:hypothetical protein